MSGKVNVFVACSLDGFIAGERNDLSWLPEPSADSSEDFGYGAFFSKVGAVLMGRQTFDTVCQFEAWPYGEIPVLVATHRPLDTDLPTVRPVCGPVASMIDMAKQDAREQNVYLDGGDLIRQAVNVNRVDEITVTIVPIILGRGIPLFAGALHRCNLTLVANRSFDNGFVQLDFRPEQIQG